MMNSRSLKIEFTKILDAVKDLLDNEANPFVKKNLIGIFKAFTEENFEISDDILLNFEMKIKISSLAKSLKHLKSLFPIELTKELVCLKNFLNNLTLKNTELWEEAEIFLKLPSIMGLKQEESKKIINIIKNIKSSKDIEEFLKEKYENEVIKKADLEAEVKKTNIKRLNLTSLINQIFQKKPKEQSVFQRIKSNLLDLNFFNNKQIYLSTSDFSTIYIGKINSCKLETQGKIIFNTINLSGEEADINIYYNDERIIKAKMVKKCEKTLEERISPYYKSFKLKEGNFILENGYISKNTDFLNEKTNFSKNGYYDIIMGERFFIKTGHYLIFKNLQTGKEESLAVSDKGVTEKGIDIRDATIKHEKWSYPCDFKEFLRYFKVQSQEVSFVDFDSEEKVNRHFQIKENKVAEYESFEIIKKTEEIYKIQTQLILLFMEKENENLFKFLIDTLLSSQDYIFRDSVILEFIEKQENGKIILDGMNEVYNLKKSIEQQTNKLEILTEIIKECNYCILIDKEQGIKTERIMELLTKGKQITDKMKGKTIIAFFGNTGSGKSTTVNYFTGVPLKKEKNNFGDVIIKIDEEEYKGTSAKIAHSPGTSETIHSEAFSLIEDAYDEEIIPVQKAKNLFLCDNPGFRDTRGSEYEICTNLSIDEAIKNCGKLQAVVLVLPFSIFSIDRGYHLIESITNLEERFPDLLNRKSSSFNSFFIAITKFFSDEQMLAFEERLTTHIEEENKNLKEIPKNNQNRCTINLFKKRLEIFQCMREMFKTNRLFFIFVEDNVIRQEQFSEIYKCKGIDKTQYKRTMEGSGILRKFYEELNKTCHTWHRLILSRYETEFPYELMKLKNTIKDNYENIARKKNEIEETKQSIIRSEQDIEINEKKLQKVLLQEEYEILPENNILASKSKELKIKELEQQIQNLKGSFAHSQKEIKRKEEEIVEHENQLADENKLLIEKEDEHKKLALLIYDQHQKNIPQSLSEFINIAFDIESDRNSSDDPHNFIEARRNQYKHFELFKDIYSKVSETLLEKVKEHLKN